MRLRLQWMMFGVLAIACLPAGLGQTAKESERPARGGEAVKFSNPGAPGVELAGTFTKPREATSAPAVLLISGAGPQDRDESMAGHKPFQLLADYLTQRNIAVLRVDDRGVGESTGEFKDATTKDFASDAQAAVRYLLARKDVDAKHVGLIGHGEGAIVAAMVAADMPEVAFAVLLSGTAMSGEKVLLAQMERAEMAAGVPEEQIAADQKLAAGLYRMALAGRSADDMRAALANVPEDYKLFTEPWLRQIPGLQSAWLRSFLSYDPSAALEQIKCPVLALFGEKDMTIDPDQNAAAMKKAFSKGHNRDAHIKTLPGLNYMFQKAKTGLGGEYASIKETMSPVALETIQSWIAQQVG